MIFRHFNLSKDVAVHDPLGFVYSHTRVAVYTAFMFYESKCLIFLVKRNAYLQDINQSTFRKGASACLWIA